MHESDRNPGPIDGMTFPDGQPQETFFARKMSVVNEIQDLLDVQQADAALNRISKLATIGYQNFEYWGEAVSAPAMLELCDAWAARGRDIDEVPSDHPDAQQYGNLVKYGLYGSIALAHQYLPAIATYEHFYYASGADKRNGSSRQMAFEILDDLNQMDTHDMARFAHNGWQSMLDTHPGAHTLFYSWAAAYEETVLNVHDPGKVAAIEAAIVLPYMLSTTMENQRHLLPHVTPQAAQHLVNTDPTFEQLLQKYQPPQEDV